MEEKAIDQSAGKLKEVQKKLKSKELKSLNPYFLALSAPLFSSLQMG